MLPAGRCEWTHWEHQRKVQRHNGRKEPWKIYDAATPIRNVQRRSAGDREERCR
jgi:hypothetical protein